MYPVARYLSIDATRAPTTTVDGDLVFLADTTGTPQVWRLDEPGAWPDRLTAHDERVSVVAASPTRPEVVFGMDAGSDERDQLYRYDLADGREVALTDRPDAIHLWGDWSPDGDRLVFTANRRAADTFDVFVLDRNGGEPELVAEGEGGYLSVEAWGEPGVVLSAANASFDQNLWLLDVETGERRRLTDDAEARYSDVQFGPEGGLYCLTDRGAETSFVGRLDPEEDPGSDDGERSVAVVEAGGDWDVDYLAVHPESGRVAWSRNVDGYSEVHAGRLVPDVDGGRGLVDVRQIDLGDCVVSALALGPGGSRCAVGLSGSRDPHHVAVVDLATGAVERWTDPGTLGIPRKSFREPETIRFESFDGREIPAYWTLPGGADESGEAVPVIVDVHGGPEHQRRPWFYPTKQFFLNRGYAVLEPNVRGSSGYGKTYAGLDDVERRLDSVRDIAAAVDWLESRPEVDSERVVAYGRSYGGFMVLSAITRYPDLWAAAVDFVGIADFETFLENTGEYRRSHREAEYGSLADDRELLASISPIHDVDEISCPLFVQHGANDPRVPVGEARQIAEAVEERGVPVETLIFDDEGHHTTSRANLIEEFERIADFLDEYV